MDLISLTLGRISPRHRTLREWVEIYLPLLDARQITPKTLGNRHAHVRRIVAALGERRIGTIRPHEINALIVQVGKAHPVAAKRTLIEIRAMLDEAVSNGWLQVNPAKAVRLPRVPVRRRRLSLQECRSLAAREYRKQGINTQDLLGHNKQAMTELYHDDRGLDAREGKWRVVVGLPRTT